MHGQIQQQHKKEEYMKKSLYFGILFIVLCTVVCIYGCAKEGQRINPENAVVSEDFQVTYLFEVDGMKVYRFRDAGHYVYICKNADIKYETGGKNSETIQSISPR